MDEMLRLVWGRYRAWAATSRALKRRLTNAGKSVFVLTALGTVLGSLSPFAADLVGSPAASTVVQVAAAATLGLAAFLTKQLLVDSERQAWAKARALAEAFKSEAYRYLAGAPPYNVANAASCWARRRTSCRGAYRACCRKNSLPSRARWTCRQAD